MKNNDFVFDITQFDIDISLDSTEKNIKLLECYNIYSNISKIKFNDTLVDMNFIGAEKLGAKSIIKVLQLWYKSGNVVYIADSQ